MKINNSRKFTKKVATYATLLGLALATPMVPAITAHAELVEDTSVETEGDPNIQDNNDNGNGNNGNEQDANPVVDNTDGGTEEETTPAPVPEPDINDPANPGYDPSNDPTVDEHDPEIPHQKDEWDWKVVPKTGDRNMLPPVLFGLGLGTIGVAIYKVISSKSLFRKKGKTLELVKKNPKDHK